MVVALKKVNMTNEKDGVIFCLSARNVTHVPSCDEVDAQFPITAIREIKILTKMDHPCVVKLYEIVTSKRQHPCASRCATLFLL
jgi:serine/threonine protein kinase